MPLLIELTIIVAAAALLCIYVGWGVARLALPPSLMPFRAPLTPLVGYATVLWTGFMLASLALNLRWTLVVLLAGATMLNVLAWRAEGRPRSLTWLRAAAGGADSAAAGAVDRHSASAELRIPDYHRAWVGHRIVSADGAAPD